MELKKDTQNQYSPYKKGVVFYDVSDSYNVKYRHLKRACVRKYKTVGFGGKITNITQVTFGYLEDISFSPNIIFSKKNVEMFLYSLFRVVKLDKETNKK